MPKQTFGTDKAPRPAGPYSQGIKAGPFVFVAGQGPTDPATGKTAGATIEEQTEQVLKNIEAILAAGGATLEDVVKVTVHLADLTDFQRFNAVYQHFFPTMPPVRTTVQSGLDNILVEIDVTAYVG